MFWNRTVSLAASFSFTMSVHHFKSIDDLRNAFLSMTLIGFLFRRDISVNPSWNNGTLMWAILICVSGALCGKREKISSFASGVWVRLDGRCLDADATGSPGQVYPAKSLVNLMDLAFMSISSGPKTASVIWPIGKMRSQLRTFRSGQHWLLVKSINCIDHVWHFLLWEMGRQSL